MNFFNKKINIAKVMRVISIYIPKYPLWFSKKSITKRQEKIIVTKIKQSFSSITEPQLSNILQNISLSQDKKKILFVLTEHVRGSVDMIKSYTTINIIKTATDLNHDNIFFNGDDLYYGDHSQFLLEFSKLKRVIETNKPDIVIFDGTFYYTDRINFEPQHINQLKTISHFSAIICVFDLYLGQPDRLTYWDIAADLFLWTNPDLSAPQYVNFKKKEKIIISPFTIWPKIIIDTKKSNDGIDFYFDGGNTRDRKYFLKNVSKVIGLNSEINLHARRAHETISTSEYHKKLSISKLTFSNGYVNRKASIVTDRIAECALYKTVILHEDNNNLNYFVTPFKHYIPIRNKYEVIIYIQFFLKNHHYLKLIREAAYELHLSHYSGEKVFAAILTKLRETYN